MPTAKAPSTACTLSRTSTTITASASNAGSWPSANGDLANARDARGSAIAAADVSRLVKTWTFELPEPGASNIAGAGSLTAAPIVRDGVVYIQDLDSNVYAMTLATGKLRWEYRCDQPERSGPGPNGVAVAGKTVYGLTPTTAFALSAATGRSVWVNRRLLSSGQGTFGIQPQVADGRVYLASQYGSGRGGGLLLTLSASTGAELWKFNTVTSENPGVRSIGLGSGGAWETPLVGHDGSVTYGIGNPYQSPRDGDDTPLSSALHRQRRQPRRGNGKTPLVLPGGHQRLRRPRHAGLANLGKGQREICRHRLGQDGLRL